MSDVATEILQGIRSDIRELRDELGGRMDALETRQSALEYQMRGMATDVQRIPEIARLLRQVADLVADHDARIQRLES